MGSKTTIFTIGHSTHPFEKFVILLHQLGVTAIADVRSVPYSQLHSQFNWRTLMRALKEQSIAYVFLGKELGGRSGDASCYENGQVQYCRLAGTELFRSGIDRVRKGSETRQIALMCAEREPLECHRSLLVGRELIGAGFNVVHIHADGHGESHEDAIKRLLRRLRLPEQDLFRSHSELIEEAYSRQAARIAFVDEQLV